MQKKEDLKLSMYTKKEGVTNDKKVDDLVYSNLLLKSYYDEKEGERKAMKNFTLVDFANEIKGSKRTLKNKFKVLEEKGLIEEKDTYYLIKDNEIGCPFVMIHKETLEYLVATTKSNVVKVYLLLRGYESYNKSKGINQTTFTKGSLLKELGYSYQTNNIKMLDDVLDILIKLNLLRFTIEGEQKQQRHIITFIGEKVVKSEIERVTKEEANKIETKLVESILDFEEVEEVIVEQKQSKIVSINDFKF